MIDMLEVSLATKVYFTSVLVQTDAKKHVASDLC